MIDQLEIAILTGDRHRIRQALADIIEGDDIGKFVDWVNMIDPEVLRSVAPELQIIDTGGTYYITLKPDASN